jgi:hypothetical protein
MRIINTLKGMLFTVIALIALTNVSNAISINGVYVEVCLILASPGVHM